MKTTNLSLIIDGISLMDIDALHRCLSEEYSYQNATKTVFLTALQKAFDEHKVNGDTRLEVRSGKCSGKGCDNCGQSGYSFVGNVTRNSLCLVVTTGNDNTVTDMHECMNFTTDDPREQIERDWFDIYILVDDRLDFNKTPEYWAKYNAAMAAYDELMNGQPTLLDFDTMDYWLNKHEFTYKRIGEPWEQGSMKWGRFTDLYYALNKLREYVRSYAADFAKANHEYNADHDEKTQLLWMLEYEPVLNKAFYDFSYLEQEERGYFTKSYSLLFTGRQFGEAFDFITRSRERHTELLEKYTTYTDDELADVLDNEHYDYQTNLAFSLKFHLERRVELDKLGVKVGFYVNGGHIEPEHTDKLANNIKQTI